MIFTIAARELRSLFLSPLAWAVLAVVQFILAYIFLSQIDNYLMWQPRLAAVEGAPGVADEAGQDHLAAVEPQRAFLVRQAATLGVGGFAVAPVRAGGVAAVQRFSAVLAEALDAGVAVGAQPDVLLVIRKA